MAAVQSHPRTYGNPSPGFPSKFREPAQRQCLSRLPSPSRLSSQPSASVAGGSQCNTPVAALGCPPPLPPPPHQLTGGPHLAHILPHTLTHAHSIAVQTIARPPPPLHRAMWPSGHAGPALPGACVGPRIPRNGKPRGLFSRLLDLKGIILVRCPYPIGRLPPLRCCHSPWRHRSRRFDKDLPELFERARYRLSNLHYLRMPPMALPTWAERDWVVSLLSLIDRLIYVMYLVGTSRLPPLPLQPTPALTEQYVQARSRVYHILSPSLVLLSNCL